MAAHGPTGGGGGGVPSASRAPCGGDWRCSLSPFWSTCFRQAAAILDSNAWLLLIVMLTMLVLFLDDARVALAPRDADRPVAITSATTADHSGQCTAGQEENQNMR